MKLVRIISITALIADSVCSAAIARAEDAPGAPKLGADPSVRLERDWSLGAGIALPSLTVQSFGIGSSLVVTTPALAISFEHRVAPSLWLVGNFFGRISHSDSTVMTNPMPPPPGSIGGVGVPGGEFGSLAARLGARWAFVTDAPVQVSVYALAGYDRSHFGDTLNNFRTEGIGAVAGLALERELIGDLSVRLSSGIFQAGWSVGNTSSAVLTVHSTTLSASMSITPTIELRFAF